MNTDDLRKMMLTISRLAAMVLKDVLDANQIKDRHGGYLTVWFEDTPAPFLVLLVSTDYVPLNKRKKYMRLSQEKAKRVLEHQSHDSSWQSREPEADQWGGAIQSGTCAISFSGLPELADEAFCLMLAQTIEILDVDQANRLAAISDNKFYRQAAAIV